MPIHSILDLLGSCPGSRLTGLVFLYELYKSEPITLSPFAAVFARALMPNSTTPEKAFLTLLLTNSQVAKDAFRLAERLNATAALPLSLPDSFLVSTVLPLPFFHRKPVR